MQFMRKTTRCVLLRFEKLELQASKSRGLLFQTTEQAGGRVHGPNGAGEPKSHATRESPSGPTQQSVPFLIDAFAQEFALFVGGFERTGHLLTVLGELIENFFAAHEIFLAGQLQPPVTQFVLFLFDGFNGLLAAVSRSLN